MIRFGVPGTAEGVPSTNQVFWRSFSRVTGDNHVYFSRVSFCKQIHLYRRQLTSRGRLLLRLIITKQNAQYIPVPGTYACRGLPRAAKSVENTRGVKRTYHSARTCKERSSFHPEAQTVFTSWDRVVPWYVPTTQLFSAIYVLEIGRCDIPGTRYSTAVVENAY